jgi:hypothetical protein
MCVCVCVCVTQLIDIKKHIAQKNEKKFPFFLINKKLSSCLYIKKE